MAFVAAQYVIMPLAGFGLAWAFRLPDAVVVGVILVGCAPPGAALPAPCALGGPCPRAGRLDQVQST